MLAPPRPRPCGGTVAYHAGVIRDDIRALATGTNYATISTLLPSGAIQTHVVWVDCDDQHLLVNTEVELRKFKNIQADPRATISIWEAGNPPCFAEVRGEVTEVVTGPEARAHIDALAQKYTGGNYPDEWIQSERAILKLTPHKQIYFAMGMHDIRR